MPVMLLPFLPLTTVFIGMFVVTSVKCTDCECNDLVRDSLDGDICWCYEEGGFGCFCCSCNICSSPHYATHATTCDIDAVYDDSSQPFHAIVTHSKKS